VRSSTTQSPDCGRSHAGQAAAELTEFRRQLWKDRGDAALVATLPELASADARPGVLLLSAVAAVVLLIAGVNVVLLLLARVTERGRRWPSGRHWCRLVQSQSATRRRNGRACRPGRYGRRRSRIRTAASPARTRPAAVTRGDELSVDVEVLVFAAALCVFLTLVCGMAPLWHLSRVPSTSD